MTKIRKVLGALLTLAVVLTCGGFSLNVQAMENPSNNLPEGWRSLNLIETAEKQEFNDISIQPKEPAPALTSLQIIDLAVDENNEIHVITREIGTSKAGTSLTWWNGSQCKENIYAGEILWGSDNIVYGYIKYFHTGVYYSSAVSGQTATVRAQATNTRNPWNTLSTSAFFTLP